MSKLNRDEGKKYCLGMLDAIGTSIANSGREHSEITSAIMQVFGIGNLEHVAGFRSEFGNVDILQAELGIQENRSVELSEHRITIFELHDALAELFVINHNSYTPYALNGKMVSEIDAATERAVLDAGEKYVNRLFNGLLRSSMAGEEFDLRAISQTSTKVQIKGKALLYPSQAEILVEFLALIAVADTDKLKTMVNDYKGFIAAAELRTMVLETLSEKKIVVAEVDEKVREIHGFFREQKSTPEFITERNKLAMAFPSLVRKYGLEEEKKETEVVKSEEPAKQTNIPTSVAAAVEKRQPALLTMNAASVVRTFEGKFEPLMSRLRSKPADKRFNESSEDLTWENYRIQREVLNKMFDTQKRSSEIASTRQLAVYADFFEYNFASQTGDKNQFLLHGVLALAINDLANKGIAVEDGLVAKAVSSLGLNADLGKMKESKFDSNAFLEKLSKLEPAKDKSPTRACGIALITAVAKGDEKVVAEIKANLETAASATSPQARQTALQIVREFGSGDERKVA